ncbi:methylamine utilization protein [Flavobacteriaceae bacterium TP-CH-4]|uniref:Methylamine utilization protein n=1 Tax=Pelagihabitans pacificus TaxID=2696054 RepID=A0A967B175_9FLAO|nr:cytochrome c peroxidase [Pelagihabitans pacificus]NHF60221.1 methylamine utilization protein [Pelagihabitans pacificus]
MKTFAPINSLFLLLFILVSCIGKEPKPKKEVTTNQVSLFNEDIRMHYFQTLDSAAHYIHKLDTTLSIEVNKANFLKSREWYKRAEPMLIAYDYENYLSMNAPNLLKIEIDDYTDIKKLKPKSYQVLEELLFGEDEFSKKELHNVVSYLQARIPYIRKNHSLYNQRDRHHLKMVRDAIINIATKGITGFDSPVLANSLNEASYNYESIKEVIKIYRPAFADGTLYEKWISEIDATIASLGEGAFDTFDRYRFIKKHTNEQLKLIKATAKDWGIALNTSRPLNPKSENLFAKDFFNLKMFSLPGSPAISKERVALGEALFNDKTLSSSGTISCATCHVKEKAFTDGYKKALGTNGVELLRNTPTLSYTVYQTSFFYDGRGDGLEGQIVSVVNNENEFHLDLNTMGERVRQNPKYKEQFELLYDGQVTDLNVRNAISTFVRSLAPFDSKFDRSMQNAEDLLTDQEILGFNLFMGKAACATCHFPPAFNGTVPPKYMETEFENLGVPKSPSFSHPVLDDDYGQYYPFKVEEKKFFFKTATVRNTKLTAPYMHNGVYKTLEEVINFYNVGGGQGMGLEVPHQTLPSDSLNLSSVEVSALIAFVESLTDQQFE